MSGNPATRQNRTIAAERALMRGLFHGLVREVRREDGKPWRLLTVRGAVCWWPWNRTWSDFQHVHGVHKGDPRDLKAWLAQQLAPPQAPPPKSDPQPRRIPPLIRPAREPDDDFDVIED